VSDKKRLDIALGSKYPNLTRSLIQKLIKNGYVLVDQKFVKKPNTIIEDTQNIEIKTDVLKKELPQLELPVLYEDDNCVVIDKPEGLLCHSKGEFNPESTVQSWLKTREKYSFDKDDNRGGIVHRLDRGTSGVMICAKNRVTLGYLQKQFQNRTTKKTYVAVVRGVLDPEQAIIDLPIDRNPKKPQTFRVDPKGKSATTHYEVIESSEQYSMVQLKPTTGRTHQLRVHLSHLKHPILGDLFYGGEVADRLYLHAAQLELTIPEGKRMVFEAKLPNSFKDKIS